MLRKPNLSAMNKSAHRNGAVASRFQVSRSEADEIRKAEARGGQQAGLVVVLRLLRERKKSTTRDENMDPSRRAGKTK
jgi:hypothetical protein